MTGSKRSESGEMLYARKKPGARVIYIVTTGGEIENSFEPESGPAATVEAKLELYLKQLRLPDHEIRILPLMQKEGSKMADFDRRMILDMVGVLLRDSAPVVVTHSFGGMVQTGVFLQEGLSDLKTPIILTAATTPSGKGTSDGLQNLTASLFAARVLDPGVYIVMHNHAFPLGCATKTTLLDQIAPLDKNFEPSKQ